MLCLAFFPLIFIAGSQVSRVKKNLYVRVMKAMLSFVTNNLLAEMNCVEKKYCMKKKKMCTHKLPTEKLHRKIHQKSIVLFIRFWVQYFYEVIKFSDSIQ